MAIYRTKSPEMSDALNAAFPHAEGQCPTCGNPVGELRDALSRRENVISHMCQVCQDSVFGIGEPEDEFDFDEAVFDGVGTIGQ